MNKATKIKKFVLLTVFFAAAVFIGLNAALVAAADAPLQRPPWSGGDWWTVDCQVYDTSPMMPGAKPGWREKQPWKFTIAGEETLNNEPHFVLVVEPIENNTCPYSFRYFLRNPDGFVSRFDMIHPEGSRGRGFKAGTVTKTFTGVPAAPYATSSFPTLPMVVPIFGTRSNEAAESSTGHPAAFGRTSQTVEKISPTALMNKAESSLVDSFGKYRLEGEAALVKITRGNSVTDSQYWSAGLPWCVYGEQQDGPEMTRRYQLTDMGKK